MTTRRAVIAVDELDAGDRVQIDADLYTLTAKPYLICGGDRWQFQTTTYTCEYFENSITIIVPSSRPHTAEEIDEAHAYALAIHRVMNFESRTYKRNARAAFMNGWTESDKVPTDATGPTYRGLPEVGQFVLVPNTGAHDLTRAPGSYGYTSGRDMTRALASNGYTRTEVLLVEYNGSPRFGHTRRIHTRAFGAGRWDTNDYLICGTQPEQAAPYGRLGHEVNANGQLLDYAKRAVTIRDNHPTPLIGER